MRVAIDHSDTFGIKFARAASKFERCQRRFHWVRLKRSIVNDWALILDLGPCRSGPYQDETRRASDHSRDADSDHAFMPRPRVRRLYRDKGADFRHAPLSQGCAAASRSTIVAEKYFWAAATEKSKQELKT